jgi:hypothetical protein
VCECCVEWRKGEVGVTVVVAESAYTRSPRRDPSHTGAPSPQPGACSLSLRAVPHARCTARYRQRRAAVEVVIVSREETTDDALEAPARCDTAAVAVAFRRHAPPHPSSQPSTRQAHTDEDTHTDKTPRSATREGQGQGKGEGGAGVRQDPSRSASRAPCSSFS